MCVCVCVCGGGGLGEIVTVKCEYSTYNSSLFGPNNELHTVDSEL